MNEIEKKAAELADITVRARMARYTGMDKLADLDTKDVLGYGAAGAGIGATGAGLVSYLAKRDKERILRDVLLGGLVGGVGGASIPILRAAPGDINKALGGDRTPQEKVDAARLKGKEIGKSLSGNEAGSKVNQALAALGGGVSGAYEGGPRYRKYGVPIAAGLGAQLLGAPYASYMASKGDPWSWRPAGNVKNVGYSLGAAAIASIIERLTRKI